MLRKPDAFLLGEFVKYVLEMMREKPVLNVFLCMRGQNNSREKAVSRTRPNLSKEEEKKPYLTWNREQELEHDALKLLSTHVDGSRTVPGLSPSTWPAAPRSVATTRLDHQRHRYRFACCPIARP
jgi:hypothetical protein